MWNITTDQEVIRGTYRRMADFVVSTTDPDATVMPTKGEGRHPPSPVVALAPTPTPKPQPTSGPAILGGDLGAFVAKYGQPNDHSTPSGGLYHFQRYSGSNLDFLIVQTDAADGGVYAQRAEGVTAQAPDAGWNQQEDECEGNQEARANQEEQGLDDESIRGVAVVVGSSEA